LFLQFTFVLAQIIISQNWILYIFMFVIVNQIRCACALNCNLSIVIWRRMFNSLKLKYTVRNNKKTKEHMKCRYMYTRIILVAVLSPTIKIFYWHLGPNLYIFTITNIKIYNIQFCDMIICASTNVNCKNNFETLMNLLFQYTTT
jgi:hypothetical protein